jgi:predicted transcriptional regulator
MKGGEEMKDLLSIRKKVNLTQKELANILGVSDVQVCRLEKGVSELSLAQYGKLLKALKLSNEMAQELIEEAMASEKPQRQRRKTKVQD